MAYFITFEGIEGSGKSTQSRRLKNRLSRRNIPVLLTHEPGVTSLGKRVERLLKWTQNVAISPVAELLLFNVSRAQLVDEVIRPSLTGGINVICDRFADSTTAYQGYARGIALDIVSQANAIGTRGLKPDLTILLDVPVDNGMSRKENDKHDRFEAESLDFHRRVREGYLALAKAEPERWVIIDGGKSRDEVSRQVWQAVSRLSGLIK